MKRKGQGHQHTCKTKKLNSEKKKPCTNSTGDTEQLLVANKATFPKLYGALSKRKDSTKEIEIAKPVGTFGFQEPYKIQKRLPSFFDYNPQTRLLVNKGKKQNDLKGPFKLFDPGQLRLLTGDNKEMTVQLGNGGEVENLEKGTEDDKIKFWNLNGGPNEGLRGAKKAQKVFKSSFSQGLAHMGHNRP
jgi:hypothetical protein